MNRKAEKFFDAVTLLREDLIEDAQNYVFRRQRSGWKKFGSLAACVMLVLSLGLVAVMPKGCGGSAPPSADMNTSAGAPPSSPAEMPPASGEPSHGDGSTGRSNTDTAPRPPQGEGQLDYGMGDGPVQFHAQVLEVREDCLLAELLPEGPGLFGTDRVRISTAGLDALPELQPGDAIFVSCETASLEDGEILAEDVTELHLAEPEGP